MDGQGLLERTTRADRKARRSWFERMEEIIANAARRTTCRRISRIVNIEVPTSWLREMPKNIHQCHGLVVSLSLVGAAGKPHAGPGLGRSRRALSAAVALLIMYNVSLMLSGRLVNFDSSAPGLLDLTDLFGQREAADGMVTKV